MTLPAPTYDLTLLLDPDAEEVTRAKIVADARAAIEARGELARLDEWGTRPLSYPIEHKQAADYYLLQFHATAPELLAELQRSLQITDGILRFRIIKLKPGVPAAPDMRAASPAGAPAEIDVVELDAVIEPNGVEARSDGQPDAPASDAPAQADGAADGDAPAAAQEPAQGEGEGAPEPGREPDAEAGES